MLIVKPSLTNLDLIKLTKDKFPNYLIFAYQVSGEYSMLMKAAAADTIALKTLLFEVLRSIKRAGKSRI